MGHRRRHRGHHVYHVSPPPQLALTNVWLNGLRKPTGLLNVHPRCTKSHGGVPFREPGAWLFRGLRLRPRLRLRSVDHSSSVRTVWSPRRVPYMQRHVRRAHHRVCGQYELQHADRLSLSRRHFWILPADHWRRDNRGHDCAGEERRCHGNMGVGPPDGPGDWTGCGRICDAIDRLEVGLLDHRDRGMSDPHKTIAFD